MSLKGGRTGGEVCLLHLLLVIIVDVIVMSFFLLYLIGRKCSRHEKV